VTGRQGGSVVVIGAGILGCSIAVHLADRGVLPVLVDAERPGQGTSTGSSWSGPGAAAGGP
jgi:glycine/D-amino acid oxidase-like deaminating enzyme